MTRKTLMTTLLGSGAFGGMTANERRLGRFIRDAAGHPAPVATPAPAAEPAPAPTEPTPDAFADAFAEHAAEPAAPAAAAAPATAEPAAPTPDAAAPAAPASGEGAAPAAAAEPAPAGTPAPAADGSAPAPVAPAAKSPADDILERLAARLEQPPAAPVAAPAAPAQPELYTPDDIATLTEYEKNWPDVAKAEQLRRKGEYHDLTKYIFEQFVAYVTPMQQQLMAVGNNLHVSELTQKVPDYAPALEDAVSAWVETQPSYLQGPYKQVMQGGTSDEVADLIGRYRAATGAAPAAPAPAAPAAVIAAPAPAPAAPAKSELSSAAMQAVASLAPVGGERTIIPQGDDKGDFTSAFSKYATME